MSPTAGKLPNFAKPPVVEVAISVQFESVADLGIAHLGLFWQRVRKSLPRVEQHPPVPHFIERPGLPASLKAKLELLPGSEMTPRLWMLDNRGVELVQVQRDRFIRNWRSHHLPQADAEYPRFQPLKDRFARDFGCFRTFLAEEGLGALKADQCEVTYVNHIYPCEVWNRHDQLSAVFKGWAPDPGHPALKGAESIAIKTQSVLHDLDETFIGRLHAELATAFLRPGANGGSTQTPIFVLNLVARGRPLGEDSSGVDKFFELGHNSIVRCFDAITTEEMHRVWEKES